MDAYVHQLYDLLPVAWQPYVALALLAAYLITKWRSNQKSAQLASQPGSIMPITAVGKDIKPIGAFGKLVNWIF